MLFGYVGARRDQIASVAHYTNLCMIAPGSLTENLGSALQAVADMGMKALVALGPVVCNGKTGKRLADWSTRLDQWKAAQGNTIDGRVEALYLPDEPYHNGWTGMQLKQVSARVKVLWPGTKQMLVEAYTAVRLLGTLGMPIPPAVGYVGFDRYGTLRPDTDPFYNADYNALKSRLGSGRKMVIVGESQWVPYYTEQGFAPDEMGPMFDSYREVARRPEVGAFVLYSYQNGFEGPDFIGAEGLPQAVLDRHIAAGTEMISG